MGWKLKVLAFFLALVMADFQQWLIVLLLFLYVFSGLIFRRRKKPAQVQVFIQYPPQNHLQYSAPYTTQQQQQQPQQPVQYYSPNGALQTAPKGKTISKRYIVGGILVFISLIALGFGGTLSPLVFGGLGVLLIFLGPVSRTAKFSTLKPVRESILLKNSYLPFRWFAFAEVKLATRLAATALSSMGHSLLLVTSKKPSIFVIFQGVALTERGASEKIREKMREAAAVMAPLDAYLLPLDSEQAVASLNFSTEPLDIDPEDLSRSLFSLPYDLLSIKPEGGYIKSLGLFRSKVGNNNKKKKGKEGELVLPPFRYKPPQGKGPMLWETLRLVETRVKWPHPDAYTTFLSSMSATQDATVGERITEVGSPTDSEVLLVKSLASPSVELSRVQLRAIVKVYSPPVERGVIRALKEKAGF